MADEPVKVHLLDREFLVACDPDERNGLIAAAELIDRRMREMKAAGGNPGFDRLAVLVALSITHEHINLKAQAEQGQEHLGGRIDALTQKLEQALTAPDKRSP